MPLGERGFRFRYPELSRPSYHDCLPPSITDADGRSLALTWRGQAEVPPIESHAWGRRRTAVRRKIARYG